MKKDLLRASSLGLEIAVAVFLCAFIGQQIDIRAGSSPLGMSIGVVVGAVAGIWNAVKIGIRV